MCALPACSAHINSPQQNMCFCVGQKKKGQQPNISNATLKKVQHIFLRRSSVHQNPMRICVFVGLPSPSTLFFSLHLFFIKLFPHNLHTSALASLHRIARRWVEATFAKYEPTEYCIFTLDRCWIQSLKLIKRTEIMHGVAWALHRQDYRISGDRVTIRCCAPPFAMANEAKQKKKSHAKIHMSAKSSPLLTEVNAFNLTQ